MIMCIAGHVATTTRHIEVAGVPISPWCLFVVEVTVAGGCHDDIMPGLRSYNTT